MGPGRAEVVVSWDGALLLLLLLFTPLEKLPPTPGLNPGL